MPKPRLPVIYPMFYEVNLECVFPLLDAEHAIQCCIIHGK